MSDPGETRIDYRAAGVARAVAARAKDRITALVRSTAGADVLSDVGSFGGLFRMPAGMRSAVLVASADGVGTKLKVAQAAARHDTIGHDLVNHCVNDILVEGARPLFFLDYIGMGRLEDGVVEQVVAGVAQGCRAAGCALLGGETAEMPDFYAPGEYDLAGFVVGVVEEDARTGSHRVSAGDALIGLPANGFHTNGYSLLRKLLFDKLGLGAGDRFPDMEESIAAVLLRVHRSYLAEVHPLASAGRVNALAHITGGGILENLDRVIPAGLSARVWLDSWQVPQEFATVQRLAGLDDDEMHRTFNMGVGMVLVVPESGAGEVVGELQEGGLAAWRLGEVAPGAAPVVLA